MQLFIPLFTNPHLLTIAASLWPRRLDEDRFPVAAELFPVAPEARVLILTQLPRGEPRGELVLVHGLEGSADGGYMRSLAQAALEQGFAVHRFNLRGCGGAGILSSSLYHSGLTADLLAYLGELERRHRTPVFLVGFSLGGNLALKLAGELSASGPRLLRGVCAVSAPIDLGVCARAIGEPRNRLYERRFLRSMKWRIRRRQCSAADAFPAAELNAIRTLYDFDDRVTAPLHGFRDAEHYYRTQSSVRYLEPIRVPTLMIQAKDDPFVPFEIFSDPAIKANPCLRLLATGHGGHLGFLSRRPPRFWLDHVILGWIAAEGRVNLSSG